MAVKEDKFYEYNKKIPTNTKGLYEVKTNVGRLVLCNYKQQCFIPEPETNLDNAILVQNKEYYVSWRKVFRLEDLVKQMRKSSTKIPAINVIRSWLSNTEFDVPYFTETSYKDCKKYIENIIKTKESEKRNKKNEAKLYFYMYIGGTPELKNKLKIDVDDHLKVKQVSPKGCDKYCTENQIGKPQNWVKLPPMLMHDSRYFEKIKEFINSQTNLVKTENNIYDYSNVNVSFIDYIRNLRKAIFNDLLESQWFEFNKLEGRGDSN